MTVSSANNKDQYTANGVNTAFTYTFKIFDQDDIQVYKDSTLQTITTHYTVSGVGNPSGGTVTFLTAPANGVVVTLKLNEPFTQEIDYVDGDDFPASSHEEGLDRSVSRDLTLLEQLDRCVKLADTSTESDITIEDLDGNTGKYVVVNAGETGFTYATTVTSTELGAITIGVGDAGKCVKVNSGETGFDVGGFPVTTGDKGDITVSGATASTWTIDNDAVTYAKIQNVSATDRILGRSSAGAGDIQEITCTSFARSILDDADAASVRTTIGAIAGPTVGTPVATTSGTSVTLASSLPNTIKQITIMLKAFSTSGTSVPQIQLGDSGGIENTSYTGFGGYGTAVTTNSSGFTFSDNWSASATCDSVLLLTNYGSNTWGIQGIHSQVGAGKITYTSGFKTLSGTLDRIAITTVGGSDTFDAGEANVTYI